MRMAMKKTGLIRRLDDHGRLLLPRSLRDSLNIQSGDEFEFYTEKTELGKNAICLVKYDIDQVDPRYKIAAEVLRELGEEIPANLAKSLKGLDPELDSTNP